MKGDAKSKKAAKDKGRPLVIDVTPSVVVGKLLRTYRANCHVTESSISKRMVEAMNKCISEQQLLIKLIVHPLPEENQDNWPVKLEPLLKTIMSHHYCYIKDIYMWNFPLSHETVFLLTTFVSNQKYELRILEMRDCLLSTEYGLTLFPVIGSLKYLTRVNLDYNEFGDAGCEILCSGLENNAVVTSLSLCYCKLGSPSGKYLNNMLNISTVRDLYLDGNDLGYEGARNLIRFALDMALTEESMEGKLPASLSTTPPISKVETPQKDKKKKKKKKGKKKVVSDTKFGPYIRILTLSDNGIGPGHPSNESDIISCMQMYGEFISRSSYLCELDLGGNPIDNLSALCLLNGLEIRKEDKLPPLKLKVTHRLDPTTYAQVALLTAITKKKRGRGKKKK